MRNTSVITIFIFISINCFCSNGLNKNAKQYSTVFQPNWESLQQYDCPEWFKDAKFGIWAHWGPQSVPEQGDWYARFMYGPQKGDSEWRTNGAIADYAYHIKNYGHPSVFGYKDLIPLFKAERWNADYLMKLYYDAGARYFVTMGQHHDNFDLWNSKYQPWNAVNMGPHKDIVKLWQLAAKKYDMKFGVSFHGFTSWSWFECSRGADTTGPLKGVSYDGNLTKQDGKGKWWEGYDPQDLYGKPHLPGAPRDDDFKQNYIKRTNDLIDNYNPDLIYFDGGIPFDSLSIASSFYNKNMKEHKGKNEAVINIKGVSTDKQKAVVLDIENGQSDDLRKYPWQTDTSFDGWFFRKGYKPASTRQIIQQLVDIVSKNGNLLLNITQRADGTISELAEMFLKEMSDWMKVNGEAIHGTRPWVVYGEGPVKIQNGSENKSQRPAYTGEDIRFTTKGGVLYAIVLAWPGKELTIKSLPVSEKLWFGAIKSVHLLGNKKALNWKQTANGLTVQFPDIMPCKYVYTLKISGQL